VSTSDISGEEIAMLYTCKNCGTSREVDDADEMIEMFYCRDCGAVVEVGEDA